MRYTNQRLSPAKRTLLTPRKIECKDYINYKVKTHQTFMHYNNALYMGDMISYKRNGTGIIVTDEGTSAIVDYCYDSMVGHNVFFKENAMASMLHLKTGSHQIALRTEHYILKLPFTEQTVCGSGVLIDFKENKIFHLVFHQGNLIKKILQTNKAIISDVMRYQFKEVLNSKHEEAFKLNLRYFNGIRIIKIGGKVHIGYFDPYGNLDGVGFKFHVKEDMFQKFEEDLEIKCCERGFYRKSRLENYGQRYFPNGNLYVGEFSDDAFNGKGVLLYPTEAKGKWVCGDFENNKLVKMLDMSLGDSQSPKQPLKTVIKGIHELNSRNWMSVKIDLLDWQLHFAYLDEVLTFPVTDVVVQKQRQIREEEERLYRIQKHFSDEYQGGEIDQVLLTQKNINSLTPEKIVVGEYSSIKTRELNIEPRCIQNEELWSTVRNPKASTHKKERKNSQKQFNLKLLTQSLQKKDSRNLSKKKTINTYTPKPVSPSRLFRCEKKKIQYEENFGFEQ